MFVPFTNTESNRTSRASRRPKHRYTKARRAHLGASIPATPGGLRGLLVSTESALDAVDNGTIPENEKPRVQVFMVITWITWSSWWWSSHLPQISKSRSPAQVPVSGLGSQVPNISTKPNFFMLGNLIFLKIKKEREREREREREEKKDRTPEKRNPEECKNPRSSAKNPWHLTKGAFGLAGHLTKFASKVDFSCTLLIAFPVGPSKEMGTTWFRSVSSSVDFGFPRTSRFHRSGGRWTTLDDGSSAEPKKATEG